MSSSSDGQAERQFLPRSRLSTSRKSILTSKPRSLSSTDASSPRSIDSHGTSSAPDVSQPHENEGPPAKRQKPSRTKGFLLEDRPSRILPRRSGGELPRNDGTPISSKGKARALGRSPLGDHVMNNGEAESPTTPLSDQAEGIPQSDSTENKKARNFIADTNQAQIVNLALNLSEGRRRQFSSQRIPSLDPANTRSPSRIVSSPAASSPYSGTFSRNLDSPKTYYSSDSQTRGIEDQGLPSAELPVNSSFDVDSPLRAFGLPNIQAGEFYPSEATLLRVQRARETLELSYQYRRLLQYLPTLPVVNPVSRSQHGRKTSRIESSPLAFGRIYNPLQYIRNRKLRRRENKPLNAEGQGWKHTEAVQEWVNHVSEELYVPGDPANSFALPSFPPENRAHDFLHEHNKPGSPKINNAPSKEGRPRLEWMVEPWNLLADAYWLEQENHKSLIEDSRSQKLYPPPLAAPIDLRKDAIRSSARRSMSIPRNGPDRGGGGGMVTDPGRTDLDYVERGRRPHMRQHSVDSNREYSGSRDRKGGWRRFIGSQSTSGAEDDSALNKTGMPSNKRSRMTAKEKQDSMILEKQLMALIAKEPDRVEYAHEMANGYSDDQSFPGMSSRPSSPEGDHYPAQLSTKTSQDLASHLGLIERTREMQPRRFSVNQTSGNELESSAKSPTIEINVSPPRSRSRHAQPLSDISTNRVPSDTEEASKLSPKSAHRARRSIDGNRPVKDQNTKVFESRLRGLLKGTKIADVVNSPVSKVGDVLRKREQSSQNSNHTVSDTEDIAHAGEVADNEERLTQLSEKYRSVELPVFQTPFRGRQRGASYESSKGPTAPSKLQIVSVGGSDRRSISRSQNRSTETSPKVSATQSLRNGEVGGTIRKHNSKDILADNERRHAVTVMGGAMGSAHPGHDTDQSLWPSKDTLHYINVTQRLLAPLHRRIYSRDVLVLQTMSRCVLVISSNIVHQRNAAKIGGPGSASPQSVHWSTNQKLLTSRNLLKDVGSGYTTVRETLNVLTQTTFPEISSTLLTIEAHISETLTPSVRSAGDNADKLSAELATTRSLEVKKLNDELDLIFRRRRRRFRWFRRGFFWMLEWTLLGAMWWAWLLVVCFRLTRGTLRAVVATVRWLLWL